MKTKLVVIVAAAGLLAGGAAQAQDALKAGGCLGCHEMDKKKVGPAFKDAAAKYKGKKDAAAGIIAKMKEGKGHPKVAKSDAEIKAAVEAALAAK
ncbi:MAG: c-type cytochrome [Pseudomonadota bacterium]